MLWEKSRNRAQPTHENTHENKTIKKKTKRRDKWWPRPEREETGLQLNEAGLDQSKEKERKKEEGPGPHV